jgi:hypothetical protein
MTSEGELDRLSQEIRRRRGCGLVTVARTSRPTNVAEPAAADRVVEARGFSGLGDRWLRVDKADAKRALMGMLERDLAYNEEIMSRPEAEILADRWFELTSEPRSFWTNGSWADPVEGLRPDRTVGPSWSPITMSTFDGGVVAVDKVQAVMLWVQDED